jgi:hypothetical protein
MATGERAATDALAALAIAPSIEEGDGNDPSVPSAAYRKMQPRWTKCRDCLTGTEAIRNGGTDYLPQYEAESSSRYATRKVLAAFYNGYSRTVLASVGMLLEQEPTLGDDMPDALKVLWENIDAAGTHGAVFSRRLATSGIVDGHAGILVEYSRLDATTLDLSRASAAAERAIATGGQLDGVDERRLGLRPYFLLFRADDVFRPLYQTVNGVRTLVLLILREVVSERKGLFGIRSVTQYRVYTNQGGVVRYELWRTPEGGTRPQLTEGPVVVRNQTSIPWAPFIAGEEIAPGEYKPPLLDLADLNIQYHRSLTNHLSLQDLAYIPTLVRIGATPGADGEFPTVQLGPRNTLDAPAQDGVPQPYYWLAPPVDVLDAGERTMASTKADMATMGAAFLSAETRAAETAEGKRIDSSAQRATLATVSRALKDCLETAHGFSANYLKVEGGSITLNEDFTGSKADPQMVQAMTGVYQASLINEEEFRHYLATGQLPEGFDPSDVLSLQTAQQANADAEIPLDDEDEERQAA